MRIPLLLLPILALPIALTGCINTDAAVFVEPTIESPAVTVGGGVLGVTVKGGFTLKLHLGPRAADSSKVTLIDFKILDAGQKAEITSVSLAMGTNDIPPTVEPDSDFSETILFDLAGKTLPTETKAKLCDPAGVVIGGVIQDSLKADATPVSSAIVHPTGCP